ncbi:uroporphyrin-III C-methyltransferase [Pluteus cervinus]|uniref:Uroporphyrin-III C-methyltransferase n=1 Tax=Pluteus cervinus TaxID=181527 RepID=A0ACD3AJJ1_9AGAR|nr:uroporphyrin-III C-methyltransferase [Pluteus cervinus]
MAFPQPQTGASLLLAFQLTSKVVLVVGSSRLAASRAFSALEAGSSVIVLTKDISTACEELRWRGSHGQLTLVDWDTLPSTSSRSEEERDLETLDAYISSTPGLCFVCVTDTALGSSEKRRTLDSAQKIYQLCRKRNILVNTTDIPELCDFTFTSVHRFDDDVGNGVKTGLQVGVTTNGKGCRLAGRLRREIVAKLPKEVGVAVEKVGRMRELAKEKEGHNEPPDDEDAGVEEINEDNIVSTPNRPVRARSAQSHRETDLESTRRRVKWVAQVSEYWPISKLAQLTDQEIQEILAGEPPTISSSGDPSLQHPLLLPVQSMGPPQTQGRILLVGSGPGHPSLLTQAAHVALTQLADLVLSDKLVPNEVLELIPKSTEVRIAKKFPGNADGAQAELMEAAVEAARKGLTVVRLKQGDPSIFGRAGEEILYFRQKEFNPVVIPGISSAFTGPTFAGIPLTQRGVAESFVVCTGVGRQGKEVKLPEYERGRTLVVLMGVARLGNVVDALTSGDDQNIKKAYPKHLPIAIIERASMPDQRTIYSTLENIVKAMENVGDQRPPGMMVIGWSVLALWGDGDVGVLGDGVADCRTSGDGGLWKQDEERIMKWLGEGVSWRVIEGLDVEWDEMF